MPAFEAIASTTLGSAAATITFSSIPSTYEHLQLRIYSQLDNAALRSMRLRFNNDSGASSYRWHTLNGNNTTVTASGSVATSEIQFASVNRNTQSYSGILIDIFDYASPNKNTTVKSIFGNDSNGVGYIGINGGVWLNTSQVNRIDFITSANSYDTGSVIALYGLKSS